MRVREFTGIHHMADSVSPEAFKAQRMAELEQMARYRATRLQAYKDWADPEKRAATQAKAADEMRAAQEMVAGTTVMLPERKALRDIVTVKEIAKPAPPKPTWRERLLGWFR